jgi:hypothetical protein
MILQLNKITHTKKVAALSIVIVCSFSWMERRARIELATRTWKDRVIPFYERRVCSNYTTNIIVCLCCLAGGIGFEPMHVGIKIRGLTTWRTPNWTGSQYKIWTCDQCVINTLLYPWANWPKNLVVMTGFEPVTISVWRRRTTVVLHYHMETHSHPPENLIHYPAENVFLYGGATRIRTEVLHLKRVML